MEREEKLKALDAAIAKLEKEYGNDLTEIELGELLCEKINLQ